MDRPLLDDVVAGALWSGSNLRVVVTTVAVVVLVAAGSLLIMVPNEAATTTAPSDNKKTTKTTIRRTTGPICPFTKDTNFVVEMAEHVPLAPLEQELYHGPNAIRWLAYGLSGQDTPGRLRAGLKRLRDSTYFLVQDENLAVELALKAKNLDARRDDCFVMEESSLAAQQEVLDLFLHHLPRRYPDIYNVDAAAGTICVRLPIVPTPKDNNVNDDNHKNDNDKDEKASTTTKTFLIADYAHAPLELCERIVQEDLILMRPAAAAQKEGTGGDANNTTTIHSYCMAAAAVVFSFGELVHKLGQPAEFIHAPVPHFQEHIQKSLNLMFSTLSPEKPLWRNNWGIAGTATLDEPLYGSTTAHEERRMKTLTSVDEVKKKYLKVEYQTIRRLPTSGYLLFTVKTMVNRLDELATVPPTAAACLASSIRGISERMHRYKGIDDAATCEAILQYLDGISAAAATTTTPAA
jgi:dimethylamine monooxygenase subunit A